MFCKVRAHAQLSTQDSHEVQEICRSVSRFLDVICISRLAPTGTRNVIILAVCDYGNYEAPKSLTKLGDTDTDKKVFHSTTDTETLYDVHTHENSRK